MRHSESLTPLLQESEGELNEDVITLAEYEETVRNEDVRRHSAHSAEALGFAEHSGGDDNEKQEEVSHAGTHFSQDELWRVFSQIKIPALSVWFMFTVTIGLFPSITVLIESEKKCENINDRFYNDLWTPFFFLLFNLFDFLGRYSANIWMVAVSRVIFFPLFLLCRVSGSRLPTIFKSDFFPIFFMIIFSLSNGYFSSVCMMLGPTLTDAKDAMLAGNIMVFCLTVGLFSGAAVSFLSLLISQGGI